MTTVPVKKSRLVAILLSGMFGMVGLQHFYLRASTTGVFTLVAAGSTGFILGFAESFLSMVALLFMSSEEFNLRYNGGVVIDKFPWSDLNSLDILKKNDNYQMSEKLSREGDDRGALAHLLVIRSDEITNCREYWSKLIPLTQKVFGADKAYSLVLEARSRGIVIQTTDTELLKLQNKCLEEEKEYRKSLDAEFTENVLKREMA